MPKTPEPAESITKDSEESEEPEEEIFTAAPEEPMITPQEAPSESKKSHEKRKRKFF